MAKSKSNKKTAEESKKRSAEKNKEETSGGNTKNLPHFSNEDKNVSGAGGKKREREGPDSTNPEADARLKAKVRKVEKGKAKKLKAEKKKKKPSRQAILFAKPTAGEELDPVSDLPPLSERTPYLHGHSSLFLPSKSTVRAMDDTTRHDYLKAIASQCENILSLLHDVLLTNKTKPMQDNVSLEDELMTDMIRLKHLPLARRCIEMTLWKRVVQFNSQSMTTVENLAFGTKNSQTATNRPGILLHESDSTDMKFNSFRDKYLKNVLDTYEDDLEQIRISEGMDEDHVKFLRRCLETSAELFANLKCWDENLRASPENVN